MGKKLRNRQIHNEFESENESTSTHDPPYPCLSLHALRKSIQKKFFKKERDYVSKLAKYHNTIQNGSISSIVTQSRFECPICLELLVRPVLTSCGHMFCERCLEINAARHPNCGLCRKEVKEGIFLRSACAQNMINQVVLPRSSGIIQYLCRSTDQDEWVRRRKLNEVRTGLIVDFQDTFRVWKKGSISKVFLGNRGQLMVEIRSYFKGMIIHETLEASSRRLAPLHFFSGGKYLEEIVPILPEYSRDQKELESLEYQNDRREQDQFGFGSKFQAEERILKGMEGQELEGQEMERQEQAVLNEEAEENRLDEALVLFNWEMNGVQLIF